MKNKLYIAITISLITGCATSSSLNPMPETHYEKYSFFAGALQHCFDKEYISPQLYAETKMAYSYALNTWIYDKNKLSSMIDTALNGLGDANAGHCRQIEAWAHELISETGQRRADQNQQRADQRQNQADINNALKDFKINKPIFCNTIGTITTCN